MAECSTNSINYIVQLYENAVHSSSRLPPPLYLTLSFHVLVKERLQRIYPAFQFYVYMMSVCLCRTSIWTL